MRFMWCGWNFVCVCENHHEDTHCPMPIDHNYDTRPFTSFNINNSFNNTDMYENITTTQVVILGFVL